MATWRVFTWWHTAVSQYAGGTFVLHRSHTCASGRWRRRR